jgi:hypothetical protein
MGRNFSLLLLSCFPYVPHSFPLRFRYSSWHSATHPRRNLFCRLRWAPAATGRGSNDKTSNRDVKRNSRLAFVYHCNRFGAGKLRRHSPPFHAEHSSQMLSATSFQITLLTGRNSQDDIQLYVLGAVFLISSAVWYSLFRLKPSVYILSAPWLFFGIAFFVIGLPSLSPALLPAHKALSNVATWSYAIASAAAFLFFGLNFGEEAVSLTNYF